MSRIPLSEAPLPPRARIASSRLLDIGNTEAPNIAHQKSIQASQARLKLVGDIAKLIQDIEDLSFLLPTSVVEGTEEDEIYRVLTSVHGHDEGSVASTFNRRFDILFKEDAQCRDKDGRLHLIRRGDLGMMLVARYLREIKWTAAEMDLDGAKIKLERILKELEILSCNAAAAEEKIVAARKLPATASSKQTIAPRKKNIRLAAADRGPEQDDYFHKLSVLNFPGIMAGKNGKAGDKL
ncbi:hypothetical protein B0H17DRAFT_1136137 [Mycena rosella]|uniref:Uncharacterized protein n=1 Tax=Mycena rosella TaxID=1033263 RepID=A0AAD7DBG4_MYCRO|nr:hypothetical protein B0H17DRAFT_1136137 [Mycena rosella]